MATLTLTVGSFSVSLEAPDEKALAVLPLAAEALGATGEMTNQEKGQLLLQEAARRWQHLAQHQDRNAAMRQARDEARARSGDYELIEGEPNARDA